MKYLLFALLLIGTLLNADRCDKMEEKADDSVALATPFELELNKTVKISGEDFGVQFNELEESRCPMHTNCIRAGEAFATLAVISKSGTQNVKLEVKAYCYEDDGTCGETKTVMGYKLKLLNIYPYPGSEDKGEKRVKLVVEKS